MAREKWEYKHHHFNFNGLDLDLEGTLNKSGKDGWEFATLFVAGDNRSRPCTRWPGCPCLDEGPRFESPT